MVNIDAPVARWNRLHPTVAAMLGGLLCAVLLLGLERAGWTGATQARIFVGRFDFNAILMRGMLGFLLFAGSLHLDPKTLKEEAGFVAALSTAGVLLSTFLIGGGLHAALVWSGREISWVSCLLFGALISPTDPVAVLAIFRRVQVSRGLAATVAAESLFNDGMGVVAFASILGAAVSGDGVSWPRALVLFLAQTGGGIALGLAFGELASRGLDAFESLPAQVAVTAAIVLAGYTGANALHVSGLLAMVVTGMRVGGKSLRLKSFWTLVDGNLNAILFGLLGLEALTVPWSRASASIGLVAIPLVLSGRALSVAAPMAAMRPWRTFAPGTFRALTWGGLRGAIPFALALSLPAGPDRGPLLGATYLVAVFSLLVQGSTI